MIAARNNLRTLAEYQHRKEACSNCALFCMCFPDPADSASRIDELKLRHKLVSRGEHLVLDGEKMRNIYVVRRGALKAYELTSDGDTMVTGFYFPGEVVGLESLFSETHKGHVVALQDTCYCEIPLKTFKRLQKKNGELQSLTQQLLCQSVYDTRRLLLTTRHLNAQARLATFLVNVVDRLVEPDDPAEFHLRIDRQDIANYLGLTIGTVSRTLSDFRQHGFLTASGKRFRIDDLQELRAIATRFANH